MHDFDLTSVIDSLTGPLISDSGLQDLDEMVPEQIRHIIDSASINTGITPIHIENNNITKPYSLYAKLSEDIKTSLSQANMCYVRGETEKSIKMLHDVIQIRPQTIQAWSALAIMHEELGDDMRSIECNMMAAHMIGNDSQLWNRLGHCCKKLALRNKTSIDQALYCFQKATKNDSTNVNCLWEQANIHRDNGRILFAIRDFCAILHIIPNTMVIYYKILHFRLW
jgi:general transcription factor 3C polypeptide 3 (transcription factor C subunit 4)